MGLAGRSSFDSQIINHWSIWLAFSCHMFGDVSLSSIGEVGRNALLVSFGSMHCAVLT
jgi:hypothetical protein